MFRFLAVHLSHVLWFENLSYGLLFIQYFYTVQLLHRAIITPRNYLNIQDVVKTVVFRG